MVHHHCVVAHLMAGDILTRVVWIYDAFENEIGSLDSQNI